MTQYSDGYRTYRTSVNRVYCFRQFPKRVYCLRYHLRRVCIVSGIYFACTMLLVSLSTLLTVVVLNVHHNEYKPVPQWLRVIVLRYLARVVCFSEVSGVVPRKDTNNRDVALHNGHANGHDISRQSTLSVRDKRW